MKNSEIKALSLEELKEKLNTESSNMQNIRFAHAISPLENPMRIRETKRLIARLNTEIRRREIEANS
ncbi:50S ribosomal protein L29 [Pontibacter cellulosilyticus]|jgi:large subunit ribosomal protein L29|uniref:Large ribosomal subunit protein uL29 n=1 Tax=Pontibacter cellulosilyticus TaxID=1720253 RepID=A0A923N659_9BACT|nr:50S ribosomal protein L29 [Pontibacter cellulosilyticus]MBC5992928.1 50S ribosomal protein L29 [Pontibacter cellulosilyticus]